MNSRRTTSISVVIPVGPKQSHKKWLDESIRSVSDQTVLPYELVVINDGGELEEHYIRSTLDNNNIEISLWNNPWNLGIVASLNTGVAIARNQLIILSCADDILLPICVERCEQAWNHYKDELGYYYLGVKYSDGREQNCACGAAMVTKDLWRYTGGFPAQCSVGAADHIFLSMLTAGSRDGYSDAHILRVSDELTYWYRVHDDTETSKNIWPAIEAVRDKFTAEWRPNT